MKRTERRHLKDNELAILAANTKQLLEERRREVTAAIVAIVVLGGAALGWFGWRAYVQSRAHAMLADAMVIESAPVGPAQNPAAKDLRFPKEEDKLQAALPKFKLVADMYPSTDAGLYARYREATIEMTLGATDKATASFTDVINRADKGLYGQMARLGLAETQARAGNFDRAISMFNEVSQSNDPSLPLDGILIELGRTYRDAGKRAEAQATFNRIVQEFPDSPFSLDAKKELDNLKRI